MHPGDRRVVVTGLGAVTPVGSTKTSFWQALIAGESGVDYISAFDTDPFPVKIAGEVKDFSPKDFLKNRKALKVMARDIQLAVAAARLAVDDARIEEDSIDRTRFGVSIGAGLISSDPNELGLAISGSVDEAGEFNMKLFGEEGLRNLFPLWLLKYLPNMLACHISIIHDAQGPNNTITAGDTSGLQAIGEASRIIQRGDADIFLAGGAESKVHPLTIIRQHLLGNLSQRSDEPKKASRPFEKNRDGLVLAEGAGVVVLEEISHAEKRGAKIYGEVVGFGSASSACGVSKADTNGSGLARSIKAALVDSGLSAENIDYILAHGLSCPLSDVAETRAIKEALGERAKQIPVSAIKSMTGHSGAASGAIEFIAAALALENSKIPPTINYDEPDPECDLDYVPNQARDLKPETALVNSFSFGGQNSSLVLRKLK